MGEKWNGDGPCAMFLACITPPARFGRKQGGKGKATELKMLQDILQVCVGREILDQQGGVAFRPVNSQFPVPEFHSLEEALCGGGLLTILYREREEAAKTTGMSPGISFSARDRVSSSSQNELASITDGNISRQGVEVPIP